MMFSSCTRAFGVRNTAALPRTLSSINPKAPSRRRIAPQSTVASNNSSSNSIDEDSDSRTSPVPPQSPSSTSSSSSNNGSSYQRQFFSPDGDVPTRRATEEVVRFPARSTTTTLLDESNHTTPVLLNAREHAVGYLSKILNAHVYDAAIETELQEAKNLSAVR
jgi:hypothetical protein